MSYCHYARKDRAYALITKYNTPAHFAVFNKEAARLHGMIRNARYYYERRLALTSSNSSKTFFAYKRRRRELRMKVENIIVNGVEISQPKGKMFRSYFSSTFRNDEGNVPQLNYWANCRIQHAIISAEDVNRHLINLNPSKSEEADEINLKILACLACYLAAPLAKLFNHSLETGIIPLEWKWSIICQIYKKGSKNDVANYRPIFDYWLWFIMVKSRP